MTLDVCVFSIPIFFVTQTPEDFKDFVYSRYHMLPCVRAIEKIVDELNFVNDNSAYVVVRIENVLIEVIVEEGRDGFFENSALVDSHASRGSKMLPYVLHDSQEALVMPQTPFFGAEMVKKFDALTKSDLESAVGDLGGKAVLLVHMGDRRGGHLRRAYDVANIFVIKQKHADYVGAFAGYIARPNPCSGESLQKFGLLKKLVSSFSAPVQEVSFLWRQMEHEAAFLKHFFTEYVHACPSLLDLQLILMHKLEQKCFCGIQLPGVVNGLALTTLLCHWFSCWLGWVGVLLGFAGILR